MLEVLYFIYIIRMYDYQMSQHSNPLYAAHFGLFFFSVADRSKEFNLLI